MSPADLLARAADRIRDVAVKATPGPWRQHDTYLDSGGYAATVLSGHGLRAWLPTFSNEPWDQTRNVWNDARWIALANPAIAPHLETILRQFIPLARVIEEHGTEWTWLDDHQLSAYRAAVELAKAVLADVETKEAT